MSWFTREPNSECLRRRSPVKPRAREVIRLTCFASRAARGRQPHSAATVSGGTAVPRFLAFHQGIHDHGRRDVAADVRGGATHVENPIDTQDDADPGRIDAECGQETGDQRQRTTDIVPKRCSAIAPAQQTTNTPSAITMSMPTRTTTL